MKKVLFLLTLILTMLASVTAGTMAMYTVSIDNLAQGSVVAKEFIFTTEGTDTFQQALKIAPSETVKWQFKVKNYQNQVVSETDMYYKLNFKVVAASGKTAIAPLVVSIKDLQGNLLKKVTGEGSMEILDSFLLNVNGQEKDYVVEIYWPESGKGDINYAGQNYGTSIVVDALASQVPLSGSVPEEPKDTSVSVLYETSRAWQNGQNGINQFEYKMTITNNTQEPINQWSIAFSLANDKIINAWSNAVLVSASGGYYQFTNPNYNNQGTDNILPGQSVTFGGPAYGLGNERISNIKVTGTNNKTFTNVKLTTVFNKPSL